MTVAVVQAALAGVVGAAGVVELAASIAQRQASRRSRAGSGSGWTAAVARLGRHVGVPGPPADLQARLDASGLRARPGDLMAAKVGAAVVASIACLPPVAALPLRLGLVVLVGATAGGFLAPDLWLARRARRRAARAGLELPDVLDLLRVAVEAGLPTGRALAEVGRRCAGLVATELRRAATAIELGVERRVALARLRARLPIASVAALTAALERADRHGAPLAPALEALAAEARADRARRLRERAARAPRIQLAVALLLVPAVMLLVAAGLLRSLGGTG